MSEENSVKYGKALTFEGMYPNILKRVMEMQTTGSRLIGGLKVVFSKQGIEVNDSNLFTILNHKFKIVIEVTSEMRSQPDGYIVFIKLTEDANGQCQENEVDRFWFDSLGNMEVSEQIYKIMLGTVLLNILSSKTFRIG